MTTTSNIDDPFFKEQLISQLSQPNSDCNVKIKITYTKTAALKPKDQDRIEGCTSGCHYM